jgi:hypothetical protein
MFAGHRVRYYRKNKLKSCVFSEIADLESAELRKRVVLLEIAEPLSGNMKSPFLSIEFEDTSSVISQ